MADKSRSRTRYVLALSVALLGALCANAIRESRLTTIDLSDLWIAAGILLISIAQSAVIIVKPKRLLFLFDYAYYSVGVLALSFGSLSFVEQYLKIEARERQREVNLQIHLIYKECAIEYAGLYFRGHENTAVLWEYPNDFLKLLCAKVRNVQMKGSINQATIGTEFGYLRGVPPPPILDGTLDGYLSFDRHFNGYAAVDYAYVEWASGVDTSDVLDYPYNIQSENPLSPIFLSASPESLADPNRFDKIFMWLDGELYDSSTMQFEIWSREDPPFIAPGFVYNVTIYPNKPFSSLSGVVLGPAPELPDYSPMLSQRLATLQDAFVDYVQAVSEWRRPTNTPSWFNTMARYWPLLLFSALAIRLGKTTAEAMAAFDGRRQRG